MTKREALWIAKLLCLTRCFLAISGPYYILSALSVQSVVYSSSFLDVSIVVPQAQDRLMGIVFVSEDAQGRGTQQ